MIVNAMVNMLYIRRFVCFNFTECLKFDYVGQNVTLGIYTLMTSMYLTFNVMFLGLISDNIQVGFIRQPINYIWLFWDSFRLLHKLCYPV